MMLNRLPARDDRSGNDRYDGAALFFSDCPLQLERISQRDIKIRQTDRQSRAGFVRNMDESIAPSELKTPFQEDSHTNLSTTSERALESLLPRPMRPINVGEDVSRSEASAKQRMLMQTTVTIRELVRSGNEDLHLTKVEAEAA